MANLMMRLPISSKSFSVSASSSSSNGSRPVIGGGSSSGGGLGPVIVEFPLEKIRRPLMRTLILGCSQVHQKLGLQTIRCKIRKGNTKASPSLRVLFTLCLLSVEVNKNFVQSRKKGFMVYLRTKQTK